MAQEHVFVFFAACLFGMSFVAVESSEEIEISVPIPSVENVDVMMDRLDSLTDVEDLLPSSVNVDYASSEEFSSVYDFTVKDLDGNDVSLSKYRGRVMVIVNYANFCGFTLLNEYYLSRMAKKYGDKLAVLMFPSNSFYQFIGGDAAARSLKKNHPEFEVFSEIEVTGPNTHPLYKFLTNQLPGRWSPSIKWNFIKFIIDQNGRPVERFILLKAVGNALKKLIPTQMDQIDYESVTISL